jgi:hypothetical protein
MRLSSQRRAGCFWRLELYPCFFKTVCISAIDVQLAFVIVIAIAVYVQLVFVIVILIVILILIVYQMRHGQQVVECAPQTREI